MTRKITPIIVFSHSYYFKYGALKILKKEKSKKGSTNFTSFTHNVDSLRFFSHYKKCQTQQDWVSFSHSLAWKKVWFISSQKWTKYIKKASKFSDFTRNVTQLINENNYLWKLNTLFFQEFSHSCYSEIPNFKYWCFKHT